MSPASTWILFAGDAVCLLAFVLLGLGTHEAADPAVRLLVSAGPLLLAWGVAGLSLGAFQFDKPFSLRTVLGRTLNTWLVAAPLALAGRALLLRSAAIPLPFLLVTLGLGGALLLAWRAWWVGWARRKVW